MSGGGHSSGGHSGGHGGYSGGGHGGYRGGNHGGYHGGSHGYYGHGGYHGGYYGGYHGGYHGGYYRGYYPYGGWYGGWGWGWGWVGTGWGWGWGWGWGAPGVYGYYGAGYGSGGYYGVGYGDGDWGVVKTDVSPEEARVFLDGRYIGTADDFDGYPDFLYLKPGTYKLEFRLEGFETLAVDVESRAGVQAKIDNKLKKIAGAKQYGSYDTPQPEGGLQRYFAPGKDATTVVSVDPEANPNGYGDWRDRDASGPPATTSANGAPPSGKSPSDPPPAGKSASDAPPPGKSPSDPPPSGTGNAVTMAPQSRTTSSRARIVFRIEPADAAVYVDDRFAGTAEELSSLSRGFQVAPGMHRIVVSRPGFGTESTQVDTAAGQAETVEITLQQR